ncbi:hypothetical protein V6N12_020261 [Hibiscus sabdariffa]|uniref:NADPH:adrenodoxin oxidoreductase, mitochondrial n=1 Tax=Hibiscus sabdariffa TaxID=183260 RepID=A0ABR1ZE67_9ROSI
MRIFGARQVLWRSFCTVASHPLRVCIVGSGPAGFYTAEKILKTHQGSQVDIIDRIPTPYGLNVINQFSRVAQNERCSFFGNIALGSSVSLMEPRELYHVVVLAYGAESDRVLGIPGEGNVALDVARILLRPTSELATTDIASHALTALEQNSIRKVYLVGRHGPVQAACTVKELREVLGIKDLCIHIKEADLKITPADEEEMGNSRIHRRIYELLSKAATARPSQPSSGQRELHFVFFRQPDRFLESYDKKGYVSGVNLEKTALKGVGSGKQIAIGTGQFENLSCGIVLKSIGYKSVAVDGLPFDDRKGVVPNVKGRVVSDNSGDPTSLENGLYVCGWLKRGPRGIIATNLYCAEETVAGVSEDVEQGVLAPKLGRDGLLGIMDERNVRVVAFSGWERIDKEEKRKGCLRRVNPERN